MEQQLTVINEQYRFIKHCEYCGKQRTYFDDGGIYHEVCDCKKEVKRFKVIYPKSIMI